MRKLSLPKKIAFSFITTAAFFGIVEGSLYLFGVKPVTSFEDPFVGFSKQLPLFEETRGSNGDAMMITAENKLNWFNDQRFPKKKPPNTFRVFCPGGSTTYGHPYWDPTSFSRWLREFLPIVDSSQKYEVINAGGISYASYRVAGVLEELAKYEPDLFVVYSVHNEFLERRTYSAMFDESPWLQSLRAGLAQTRTWAAMKQLLVKNRAAKSDTAEQKAKTEILSDEVDEILNHTIGPVDYHRDVAWKSNVIKHYEFNLRRMVDIAHRSGAKIVFLTPASNEKDCSPFKSEVDSSLSSDGQRQVHSLLKQSLLEIDDDNLAKAAGLLEQAVQIDPRLAEAQYRLGKIQFELKRFGDAEESFKRALNEDICPLRAVDEILAAVHRVGKEKRVSIIDFEGKLRALCKKQHGHAILGEEYFMDHVHPTVEVHQQMARWIIQVLQENEFVGGKSLNDSSILDQLTGVVNKIHGEMEPRTYGVAQRNLAKVLHWAGKYDEAEPRARDALLLLPNDPESRFVLADCLRNTGRPKEAIAEYDELFAAGGDFERAYHPFGDLLAREGEYVSAKAYLMLAALRQPKNALIYNTLGVVHLRLSEFKFAIEALEEADRLAPNDPRTWYFLAQAKVGNNEPDEAIELFEKALAQGFEPASVHFGLGMLYFEKNATDKAIEHFETTLKLDPTFEEAYTYLELARKK